MPQFQPRDGLLWGENYRVPIQSVVRTDISLSVRWINSHTLKITSSLSVYYSTAESTIDHPQYHTGPPATTVMALYPIFNSPASSLAPASLLPFHNQAEQLSEVVKDGLP